MKIILLQNIKGVGRMGDIKNVSDGYGRNYLLANKLAKLATSGTVKEVDALKRKAELEVNVSLEKVKEAVGKVQDVVLEFTKKASKTGKLFASLTKEEIAEELSKAIKIKVEAGAIDLNPSTPSTGSGQAGSGQEVHGEHIKQAGEHLIGVELTPEVRAEFKVVIKEE